MKTERNKEEARKREQSEKDRTTTLGLASARQLLADASVTDLDEEILHISAAIGYVETIIDVVCHSDHLTTVLSVAVNYRFLGTGLAYLLGAVLTAVGRVVFVSLENA